MLAREKSQREEGSQKSGREGEEEAGRSEKAQKKGRDVEGSSP
jgi:hypothetical protein